MAFLFYNKVCKSFYNILKYFIKRRIKNMICVNFEKDVLWQVLTVQVDELVDKIFSLKNDGEKLFLSC